MPILLIWLFSNCNWINSGGWSARKTLLNLTVRWQGFDKRYQSAVAMAKTCRFAHKMRITDLEVKLGLRHTALTLNVIKTRMRHCQLVWVMGADNLVHFHKWHKPKAIAKTMAIAVVNRPGSVAAALSSPGAKIAGRKLPLAALSPAASRNNLGCFYAVL